MKLQDLLKEIKNEMDEDFGMSAKQLPTFSSKEAKKVIDTVLDSMLLY